MGLTSLPSPSKRPSKPPGSRLLYVVCPHYRFRGTNGFPKVP